MKWLPKVWKSATAFGSSLIVGYFAANTKDNGHITQGDWIALVVVAVITGIATYVSPKNATGATQADSGTNVTKN